MTETQFIERCRQGDVGAYKWIYDQHHPFLLRTACRVLGNRQDAEDAVQQTFIKLYRSIGRFRGEAKFSTYLYRILMNVCFDRLAKKKRMKMQTLDSIQTGSRPRHDLRLSLESAIDSLPPQMKTCFVLFAVEGLKQTEIAEILNISTGGVKSNIFHAKNKLRTILTDSPEGKNHAL